MIAELARRSVGKLSNTVRLLRYNSQVCYFLDINVRFKAYRCPSYDAFFNRAPILERHLTTCSERVEHVYPNNMYQLRETLFDKLDSFGIPYMDNQKLFSNMAILDIQSICVADESFRDTETTTWVGKNVSLSASIQAPIFVSDPIPCDLVLSFIDENFAMQSKTQIKMNLPQIETAIKSGFARILETLNQRRSYCVGTEDDNSSTQFLQMQKNKLITLPEHSERYCKL